MKPYPFYTTASEEQLNLNYNLSKARKVEKKCIWPFKGKISVYWERSGHYKNNNAFIRACCILHNILSEHNIAINETCQPTRTTKSD